MSSNEDSGYLSSNEDFYILSTFEDKCRMSLNEDTRLHAGGSAVTDIDITDWMKLGSVIRSARKSAGLTQQELAKRSGTARSWIARIEAGLRKAELEQLLLLLDALDLRMRLHSSRDIEAEPSDMKFVGIEDGWFHFTRNLDRASQQGSWAESRGAASRARANKAKHAPGSDEAAEQS